MLLEERTHDLPIIPETHTDSSSHLSPTMALLQSRMDSVTSLRIEESLPLSSWIHRPQSLRSKGINRRVSPSPLGPTRALHTSQGMKSNGDAHTGSTLLTHRYTHRYHTHKHHIPTHHTANATHQHHTLISHINPYPFRPHRTICNPRSNPQWKPIQSYSHLQPP